ncbi:MAG: hypothetical protein A2Y62_09705 [Candidatus Fischerbacteria bacterium RBG_13_37_8]|uniref:Uncharacterized protein n=1 Tax=Candidatus Fischerbacteria bacterium RBG_13_37_8 TaxID=1817863 RepID=A0A1F5V5U1_9BACT|nr:MAG: hypothetical protein A2Y62_09705 [Candidatus Fischerbacteria bacterium RBG_13_37_8]
MNKKNIALPGAIGVAAVWFGSHAGAGFATGRQEVSYFVTFGYHAVWIGFFAMLVTGAAIYIALEIARIYKVYDYKNWLKILFAPYPTVPSVLWEIFYLYGAIVAAGAVIAGAADLVRQTLHIHYGIGVVIVAAILLLLTIFGSNLVRNASTGMAVFMIAAIIVVTLLGIKFSSANLSRVVAERETTAGFGTILWMAFIYGAFQSILVAPVISVAETLQTRKNNILAALLGTLVNGGMLILVCIMLLGFFPAISKENLPVYYVTTKLGISWLFALYTLILFFALISTGVGLIYGVIKRFEVAWTKGSGIFQSVHMRRCTICFLCMIVSTLVSLFGLTTIVNIGYYALGLIAIFLNIIPLFILAPLKLIQAKTP